MAMSRDKLTRIVQTLPLPMFLKTTAVAVLATLSENDIRRYFEIVERAAVILDRDPEGAAIIDELGIREFIERVKANHH